MYFADLTPYAYLHGLVIPDVLNIDWLDDQQIAKELPWRAMERR